MQTNSPPLNTPPLILENLVNPPLNSPECPRRTRWHLDLILLALEALDLGGSEAMLAASKSLQLQEIIQNRVTLWRLRSTNPFRRAHMRRSLSLEEAKALVAIAATLARKRTVLIRQLLVAYDQLQERHLCVEHHFRLSEYLDRFRAHFRSRMNLQRSALAKYQDDPTLNELGISLLSQLLFCTGTKGMQRLWISLFDGEVA